MGYGPEEKRDTESCLTVNDLSQLQNDPPGHAGSQEKVAGGWHG